jgi:hypothetical protein
VCLQEEQLHVVLCGALPAPVAEESAAAEVLLREPLHLMCCQYHDTVLMVVFQPRDLHGAAGLSCTQRLAA